MFLNEVIITTQAFLRKLNVSLLSDINSNSSVDCRSSCVDISFVWCQIMMIIAIINEQDVGKRKYAKRNRKAIHINF